MKNYSKNLQTWMAAQNAAEIGAKLRELFRIPFVSIVITPVIILTVYQAVIASERYESEAIVIVKSSESSPMMDASAALLSGLGGGAANTDPKLVVEYIHSWDLLVLLDERVNLIAHFSGNDYDIVSRLSASASREDVLAYYRDRVHLEIDSGAGIIRLKAQGFTPEFAKLLASTIVSTAEDYINSVGNDMAMTQISFIEQESLLAAERLGEAQQKVIEFQAEYGLLDPRAESASQQQITYSIEQQISMKEAQLASLLSYMSDEAPQVIALRSELAGLFAQRTKERELLTQSVGDEAAVNELLAHYMDLKMRLELATKIFSSSLVSLEVARVDAYKKLKFLAVIQSPTLPQDNSYPRVFYNALLLFIVLTILFITISIIVGVYKELESNR